jgi:predicted CXXCH cytochrome family protein
MTCSEISWLAAVVVLGLAASAHAQPQRAPATVAPTAKYAGSAACRSCHTSEYERWQKTPMANIVVDVKAHPEAIVGDFSKPNEFVTFKKSDIAFTYGSIWKQRYFTKIGDDYFVFPAQWDIQHKVWRRYYVAAGTDWWVEHYPAEQMQRPTGPLCDGCHSTNFDVATKKVTEWNVGCEQCHGPGAAHVEDPALSNIVNPARLDFVRANDVCIQCHSQGRPKETPLNGVYYDWPVGYRAGDKLSDFWTLEEHKLGETTFTHWPEGSAHKNRMQGNDFVQSQMYTHGVTCAGCHDVHGTQHGAELVKPKGDVCLTCHGPQSPNGPRGTALQHSQHSAEKATCVDCHMPKIATEIADVNVRSHTFRFISPADSEKYGVPNACTSCHKDKDNAWAAADLAKWPNVSAWRVAE